MKRLQIYIEEELDDALAREALREKTSKAALIRRFVADRLFAADRPDPIDDLVGWIDADPGTESIDEVVYGF